MKHVKQVIINLCLMIYCSFVLFLIGTKITDSFKWISIVLGAGIVILLYCFVVKKIDIKKGAKQFSTEKKEIVKKRLNRIKKIVSFFTYSLIIICIFVGISNDGEFIIKFFYPFFKKRISNNEIFNWMTILSPLVYINGVYHIYNAIIQMIIEKYDLSEDKN